MKILLQTNYFNFNLDIITTVTNSQYTVVQNDVDVNILRLKILKNGVVYTLTDNMTALINFLRSDGVVYVGEGTINTSTNLIEYTLQSSETDVNGLVTCSVSIFDGTQKQSTQEFSFTIRRDINDGDVGEVPSTSTPLFSEMKAHIEDLTNPHEVTKTQVGLSNVTDDEQLPLSYLDTDNTLSADSDVKVASQKAVKGYMDAKPEIISYFVEPLTQGESYDRNTYVVPIGYVLDIQGVTLYLNGTTVGLDTQSATFKISDVGVTYFYAEKILSFGNKPKGTFETYSISLNNPLPSGIKLNISVALGSLVALPSHTIQINGLLIPA